MNTQRRLLTEARLRVKLNARYNASNSQLGAANTN